MNLPNEDHPLMHELLEMLARSITEQRRLPESTYRLQLHKGFTFRDAAAIAEYLRDLGISHCYASPYLQACPGSMHGYDITNHAALNPEIGSPQDYDAWVQTLRANGLGQVLDIVPNHMGIVGNENLWWNDVLENGQASPYAKFFDIAWNASPRPKLHGRVLLPMLGEPYGKVLESGQLRMSYANGAFTVSYFDHRFPLAPRTYETVLGQRLEELERALGADSPALAEYQSILTALRNLPDQQERDPARLAERQREKEVVKRRLAALTESTPAVLAHVEQNVAVFNGHTGDRHSFDLLDALLNEQPYRLCYWRVAPDEINYRRFFDVNELAALNMERPEVFAASHALILRLLREHKIDGLRIDHPDGLFDPKQYLDRLQEAFILEWAGERRAEIEAVLPEIRRDRSHPLYRPLYVVVEKILGTGEALPDDWPVWGTSGYDFLNVLNGLFVDAANARAFTRLYHDWTQEEDRIPEVIYRCKRLILDVSLSSELYMLAYRLDRLAQKDRRARDFTLHTLRRALREVVACFPVYRSYITQDEIRQADRDSVERAVARARRRNPALSPQVFDFLRDVLLLRHPDSYGEADREEQRRFVGKFQQVTAPVMAKGLEDTAFYVYNRLLSLNEVGGDPARFGVSPETLHRVNQDRQARWPRALSPLSTHDTKRSEDVRARLNVLSEMPGEWQAALERWSELNTPHRLTIDDAPVPDRNEEYFIYQTLLGAWPLEPYEAEEYRAFIGRVQEYMTKALHEAKVHTSWINPYREYDEAVLGFVGRILDEGSGGAFLADFRPFQRRISHYGLFNSLSQTLLKITSPGAADTYQGTELWDFSLVDPDNRRPVDYDHRRNCLRQLREWASHDRRGLVRQLLERPEDDRLKLYVTWQALSCRLDHPGLFAEGAYLPGDPAGARAEHVFGFARRDGGTVALVVVPRLLTRLGERPLGAVWGDTKLAVAGFEGSITLQNLFTGDSHTFNAREGRLELRIAEILSKFPVALLVSRPGG
jgi:(1->4)-alpha-D-glucan 1-alpha-D-glucosylmutase